MARDTEDPKDQLKQGLGMLFRAARGAATSIKREVDRSGVGKTLDGAGRAARGAATSIKREVDRSGVGKTLDDAGREIARAANNVIGRIGSEIQKAQRGGPGGAPNPDEPAARDPKKPTGPTKSDPGFRIAVPDDDDGKSGDPH
jgi:hypothetical protein